MAAHADTGRNCRERFSSGLRVFRVASSDSEPGCASAHDRGFRVGARNRRCNTLGRGGNLVREHRAKTAAQSRPQFRTLLSERELRLEEAQLRAAIEASSVDETREDAL